MASSRVAVNYSRNSCSLELAMASTELKEVQLALDVEKGAELAPAAGERVSAATESQEVTIQHSVRLNSS